MSATWPSPETVRAYVARALREQGLEPIPFVSPVTVEVQGPGIVTDILLTTHRPWTAAERAIVEAAEAEAAANDPTWSMV